MASAATHGSSGRRLSTPTAHAASDPRTAEPPAVHNPNPSAPSAAAAPVSVKAEPEDGAVEPPAKRLRSAAPSEPASHRQHVKGGSASDANNSDERNGAAASSNEPQSNHTTAVSPQQASDDRPDPGVLPGLQASGSAVPAAGIGMLPMACASSAGFTWPLEARNLLSMVSPMRSLAEIMAPLNSALAHGSAPLTLQPLESAASAAQGALYSSAPATSDQGAPRRAGTVNIRQVPAFLLAAAMRQPIKAPAVTSSAGLEALPSHSPAP